MGGIIKSMVLRFWVGGSSIIKKSKDSKDRPASMLTCIHGSVLHYFDAKDHVRRAKTLGFITDVESITPYDRDGIPGFKLTGDIYKLCDDNESFYKIDNREFTIYE